jgi:hypothetical protein
MNAPLSNENDRLIEVWRNVERVLVNLPEHERTHHFDMSGFVEDTACGTVCCAAGHCAFDPWFRERGWKAVRDPDDHEYWCVIGTDILRFFGYDGAKIFHDLTRRPIAAVIDEVRGHIANLQDRARGIGFAYFRQQCALTALEQR